MSTKTAKPKSKPSTPRGAPSTATAIKEAERALARRKAAHRTAFRAACVKLFNDYGYALEADGDLSAHLKITELRNASGTPIEALITDIPE